MSYKEKIEDLGFNCQNGLHFFSDRNWKNRFSKRVEDVISLKLKPYAIYEFNNEPFILFFENRQKAEIHQWCWNLNSSPLIIIHEENQVKIYNGFSFDNKEKFLRLLAENERQIGDFNYINLVSGKFLEKYGKNFAEKNRVDYKLLENIKTARDILIHEHNLEPAVVNSLIGRIIFVRYLIDRKVKVGKYGELTGQDLLKILTDREKTYTLFAYLREKFNGNLFPIDAQKEAEVREPHLEWLIKLLKGHELKTGQRNLFEFYDFSVIPIEFISNIYEFFLGEEKQKKEGAYYTPPFLVDYILKYTVDSYLRKENQSYRCKVLDPACGSGIFLVETLRRLIHRYRELNPYSTEDRETYKEELRKLLCDNIFGIDNDENAIKIAVFSLYIALLDYQEPKDIENFKFPELIGSNFFKADFFNSQDVFNSRLKDENFNFIIGNPPWGNISKKGEKNDYIDYCEKQGVEIGRKEISQAFLLRSGDFSGENTGCALIVTSKNLYNIESSKFREFFLENYKIERVFELSSVRRQLFNKSKNNSDDAIAPAAVIFYRYAHEEKTGDQVVRHISLKPNPLFDLFKIFIIEKFDYKEVLQEYFKKYDWLFKTLVYGNILDFYFIKRLKEKKCKRIIQIIGDKNRFIFGQGAQVGGGGKNDAGFLLSRYYVDTKKKMLQPFRVLIKENVKWKHPVIHRPRTKPDIYLPPMLLVKKGTTWDYKIISAVCDERVAFTDSITSIKAYDINDKPILKLLSGLFYSRLFSYYFLNTGSSSGIEREQCHNADEKFSFPFLVDERIASIVEEIEQNRDSFSRGSEEQEANILNSAPGKNRELLGKEFIALQEKLDETIFNAFGLSRQEKALVEYVQEITIPVISGKFIKKLDQPVPREIVEEYVQLFIDHFDSYFRELDKNFTAEIYQAPYVLGINFVIRDEKPADNIQWKNGQDDLRVIELLANKSFSEISNDIFVLKDVKGFEKNSFYVIKPNQYRLWHKAIAYLDINEFSDALLESGRKSVME